MIVLVGRVLSRNLRVRSRAWMDVEREMEKDWLDGGHGKEV